MSGSANRPVGSATDKRLLKKKGQRTIDKDLRTHDFVFWGICGDLCGACVNLLFEFLLALFW